MISSIEAKIKACAIHRVGNKLRDEGYVLSENQYDEYDSVHEFLIEYFLHLLNLKNIILFITI